MWAVLVIALLASQVGRASPSSQVWSSSFETSGAEEAKVYVRKSGELTKGSIPKACKMSLHAHLRFLHLWGHSAQVALGPAHWQLRASMKMQKPVSKASGCTSSVEQTMHGGPVCSCLRCFV